MILLSNLEINNSWEASHNCISDSYHIFQAKIYYPGVTIAYMFPPYVLMYVGTGAICSAVVNLSYSVLSIPF